MPLPLLGLLGLGAAAYAEPYVTGRRERMLTDNRARIREGILAQNPDLDMSDPAAVGSALFRGGLLEPDDFQRDIRTGFEGVQDRAAAERRQRIASGPSYMNAQLAREKFERENQLAANNEAYQRSQVMLHGTPQEQAMINNPLATPQSVASTYANVQARVFGQADAAVAANAAQTTAEAVGGERGAGFGFMTPDQRNELLALEAQVVDVTEAVDYFTSANIVDRLATDRGTATRLATQFRDAAVSFQQKYKEAGALQAADLEFFDSIIGDPTKLAQLSSAEQQRIQRTANVMKRTLAQQTQVFPQLYPNLAGNGVQGPPNAFNATLERLLTPYTFASEVVDPDQLDKVPKTGQATDPDMTFDLFGGP